MTSGGTSLMARTRANSQNATLSASESRITRKYSPVKPDGPAAAPRRDLRRFCNNNSPSKTTWSSGLYSMSSRATGALGGRSGETDPTTLFEFSRCQEPPMHLPVLALHSRLLPTASTATPFSRACPSRRHCSLGGVGAKLLCCTIVRLLRSPPPTTTTPRANAWQRSESFALDTTPPRGVFVSNIRGTSVNNFHARVHYLETEAKCCSNNASHDFWDSHQATPAPELGVQGDLVQTPESPCHRSACNINTNWHDVLKGWNVPTTSSSSGSEWRLMSSSPSSPPSLPAGVWMAWNSAVSVSDSPGGSTTCGRPDALGTPGSSLISAETGEKRFACRTTGVFTNVGVNRDGRAEDAADPGTVQEASSSEESMRVRSWWMAPSSTAGYHREPSL